MKRWVARGLLIAFGVLTILNPVAQAAWYYVDGATGNDSNTCLPGDPCKTIQAAINKAGENDGVYVLAGTYSTAANGETFPITIFDKSLYLEAFSPEVAIIDASGSNQNVIKVWGGGRYVEIKNLTIKKGVKGIELLGYSSVSQPIRGSVQNCNITENTSTGIWVQNVTQFSISGNFVTFSGSGGTDAGIYNYYSNPSIINNVIAGINGSGIFNDSASPPIVNNTIFLNYGGGGIANLNSSNPQITNNIITSNGTYGIHADISSSPVSTYNDVWANAWGNYYNVSPGLGSLSSDPRYVSLFDLHLKCSSPAINAGDNAVASSTGDKDGNPRIVGGKVDLGAYERQTQLYCPTYLPIILKE